MDKEKAPTRKKNHTQLIREPLAVGYHKSDIFLLLRITHANQKQELYIIKGKGDTLFTGKPYQIHLKYKKEDEDIESCHDFKFFCDGDDVTMTYLKKSTKSSVLRYAATEDRKTWIVGGELSDVSTPAVLVPEMSDDAGDIIYFEGKDSIRSLVSTDLKKWTVAHPPRVPQWNFFDGLPFRIIGAKTMDDGIALFFESHITTEIMTDSGLRDEKVGEERFVKIGVALFSKENPLKLLWQTELPLAEVSVEHMGGQVKFLGVVPPLEKSDLARFYIMSKDGTLASFEISNEIIHDHRKRIPFLSRALAPGNLMVCSIQPH
jgi:hypothetical protein